MATSYANTGGSGDRTAIITITASNFVAGTNPPTSWVNGNTTTPQGSWYVSGGGPGDYLRFDFGSGASKIIDEAKHYQNTTNSHSNFQWQGSDNASSWTDIGSSFTLGGSTTQTITALSGNTTGYRYYQIVMLDGPRSSSPDIIEWEFKIEDAGGGGTTPKGPLSNPFMGPFGGPVG